MRPHRVLARAHVHTRIPILTPASHLSHRAEKLKSTFQLFDLNGDGMINLEELSTYLASFFRVMAALDGQFCSRFVLTDGSISTPKEIATATAKNAFMSADLNKDGKLSFDEFCKWYRGPAISFCSVKE